jgi:lysozyme family protein
MKPFDFAFEQTLCLEGGYSDDPADRGGRTKWGITEATLKDACKRRLVRTRDVSRLSKEEARLIYKADYWDALKLDSVLSPSIAAEIFDTAVNMGRSAAVKIIQEALNYLGESLALDGVMGMKTLTALNKWAGKDERALFVCLNGFQFIHYVGIVEVNATQKRFARGWTKRIQTHREE